MRLRLSSIVPHSVAYIRIRLHTVVCVRFLSHPFPAYPRGFLILRPDRLILFVRPPDRRGEDVIRHRDQLITALIFSVHERVEKITLLTLSQDAADVLIVVPKQYNSRLIRHPYRLPRFPTISSSIATLILRLISGVSFRAIT